MNPHVGGRRADALSGQKRKDDDREDRGGYDAKRRSPFPPVHEKRVGPCWAGRQGRQCFCVGCVGANTDTPWAGAASRPAALQYAPFSRISSGEAQPAVVSRGARRLRPDLATTSSRRLIRKRPGPVRSSRPRGSPERGYRSGTAVPILPYLSGSLDPAALTMNPLRLRPHCDSRRCDCGVALAAAAAAGAANGVRFRGNVREN